MKAVIVALTLTLTACAGKEYTAAHGLVLCDPQTGAAFYVADIGFGRSRVKRTPHFDGAMCERKLQ